MVAPAFTFVVAAEAVTLFMSTCKHHSRHQMRVYFIEFQDLSFQVAANCCLHFFASMVLSMQNDHNKAISE